MFSNRMVMVEGGSKVEMEKDDEVHNRGREQEPSLFITITEA